jgi:plasmanylethanolamine desaturase
MASKPSGIAREAATLGNVLAAGVFLGAVAPFVRRAVEAGVAGEQPAALIGAALLGAVAADLASGVVHWACDTFFAEDTPVIGRALIFPFREHHRDPLALTRRTFLRLSSSNFLGSTGVLALVWCLGTSIGVAASPLFDVWATTLTGSLAVTNQIHKWAHSPRVPRPIAWLQAGRLILTPSGHHRHHATGVGAFCITTGWLNPALDRLAAFAVLERMIDALGRKRLGALHAAGREIAQ